LNGPKQQNYIESHLKSEIQPKKIFVSFPERFIDATTGKVKGDERFIPFGTGTRVCIGSTLAQNELYLFLAAFLQRFQFSNPTPEEIEPVAGFVLGCPDFQMNIQEREEMIVKAA